MWYNNILLSAAAADIPRIQKSGTFLVRKVENVKVHWDVCMKITVEVQDLAGS